MTSAPLAQFAARAQAAGRFGLDTEFVGEGRYRTLLCLIQLVVSDAEGLDILVVDTLDDGVDLKPLAAALADPEVSVVVHAGRQDVALLRRCAHTSVTSIFDTQVAAGFAGLSAQAAYDTLLRELLGVHVQKTASYTRWDRRPLDVEQLAYAREDVLHLLEMADTLESRLGASGRLDWAREECRGLETASDVREPEQLFGRLPRINSLSPSQRAIAHELVVYRERLAEEQDRPAGTVLSDVAIVELAKRAPRTREQLEQIRGVNAGSLRRRGVDLLAVIADGARRPAIAVEGRRHESGSPVDAPQVALAEALVRTRALEAGLAYELVAARADLAAIVASVRRATAQPDVRTLSGWRRELVGDELLATLRGGRSLRVGPDGRLEIATTPSSQADLQDDPSTASGTDREPATSALAQRRSP
ncbi:MAG TPA: HRDC domain-containing protein [Solirubrobacteraceae bacterium]|nr:HRDC domain-containing protein [Solirubrobacteraceae bacterium]